MNDNLSKPRTSQRCRARAQLATDRASDPGAATERWLSIAARLYDAAELYEKDDGDRAAAIVAGVVDDLLRNSR